MSDPRNPGQTDKYTAQARLLTSPLANAVLSWRSVEGHRSLSRRRIIRGPAGASTPFYTFFAACRRPRCARARGVPKVALFPRKNACLHLGRPIGDDAANGPATTHSGGLDAPRPQNSARSPRPPACPDQAASRAARQSLYSCWSIRAFRKRSRCSCCGISRWPKRSSSSVRASVAPA